MNIAHFSTEDINGGAAKAAYRLHSALRERGCDSWMVVRTRRSDDDDVYQVPPPPSPLGHAVWKRVKERIPIVGAKTPRATYTYNFDLDPDIDQRKLFPFSQLKGPQGPGKKSARTGDAATNTNTVDILCLHWVSQFLNTKLVRRLYDHYQCPIVWILADQDPLTGGCHYSFECEGYTKECGRCPQLNSDDPNDRSHQTWRRRRQYLSGLPICFVAPTTWGVKRVQQSSLFGGHRVESIPYPIDTSIFRPFDRNAARDLLRLPADKKLLFFGASYLEDRRKGMAQLVDALRILAELIDSERRIEREEIFLLVAGRNARELMSKLPFAGTYAGHFNDDLTLALAYQAADVFVCPSIEDAGPMMIPESMLCGTPVAAFDGTGAPDLVKSMQTGYLAVNGDARDLARGIYALLISESPESLRRAAHNAATRSHAPALAAARHVDLYESLVAGYTKKRL
jgi:glycosyltransferase involved in cell wall biosynthesis